MIENLPNLITKYEIDIDHSLFYYEGEYSYTFAYNVNDFILNGENYLYKVKINQKGMKNDEDNLVYLVITDLHLLLIKPENEQKNKGKIFYIGNLVDIDSFAENNPKIKKYIKEKLAEGIYLLNIPVDANISSFINQP